jgi:hypothetical protein
MWPGAGFGVTRPLPRHVLRVQHPYGARRVDGIEDSEGGKDLVAAGTHDWIRTSVHG